MSIVTKPRQIRIDLDPDAGFPSAMFLESTVYVEEGGVKIVDLPIHAETLQPDSEIAKKVIGEESAAATKALFVYQSEVQRLARRVEELEHLLSTK
jgi:hypothetical protein